MIDDETLKNIIKRLYFPESPYEFSVLPAEILGQIYEQFLGKVIRLDEGHNALVEDKPEVKKAGGVKYTPAYIVEYIVQNTIASACSRKRRCKRPQPCGCWTRPAVRALFSLWPISISWTGIRNGTFKIWCP